MKKSLCAGIVLYNPSKQRLRRVLRAVLPQVDELLIINNGSPEDGDIALDSGEKEKVSFIQNSENIGVAAAFNQIISFADKNGYEWCLILDQDSVLSDHAAEKMLMLTDIENTGLICPVVFDENRRKRLTPRGGIIVRSPFTVISSGCCINVRAARSVGGFREELFIDFVDFDFNERLMRTGYRLLRCINAAILHELGDIEAQSFFKRSHSAKRLYYMSRNAEDFLHRYRKREPGARIQLRLAAAATISRILLFEADKKAKLAAIRQGRRDYKKVQSGYSE